MSSSITRKVVIDDTSSLIRYVGPWITANGQNYDTQGNFGATFNNSLHGTTGVANFSFSFSGSQVYVSGTISINNSTGVPDPSWGCFMDSVASGTSPPFGYIENNWPLCQWDNLADGPHVLEVHVTSKGQTFWFDQINYTPSPNLIVNETALLVDHKDADIHLDSSWADLGGIANYTSQKGAQMQFSFVGTGLSWYGFKPTELPHGPTTASYVVDNQSAVTFTLPGLPKSDIPTQYNQKFFETLALPFGLHNITVTHGGDPSLTPLVLGTLVVMNGTTSKTLPAQISSPSKDNHVKHARNLGIIIGPVFAAVVISIIVSTAVIIHFRRRKAGKNDDTELSLPSASTGNFASPDNTRESHNVFLSESTPFMSTAGLQIESPSHTSSANLHHSNTITRTMRKQEEALAAFNLSPGSESGSSRYVLHQDSGVRMMDSKEEVVELPPSYTPS